jgi:hypothetical protein
LRDLGIDGVWMDSYPNITVDCVNYKSPDEPVYDIGAIFRLTAELIKMGCWVGYEGAGPLGIPCAGSVSTIIDNSLFSYQRIYGWQKLCWGLSYVAETNLTRNYYYMSCANKIPAAIIAGAGPKPIHALCPPKLAAWIIQANKDYKAVCAFMQYRHLIPSATDPEEEKAVEWTQDAGKTRVLWAYDPFDYDLPQGAAVRDVTSGKAVACTGKLRAESWHTYAIALP